MLALLCLLAAAAEGGEAALVVPSRIEVVSSMDGEVQPCFFAPAKGPSARPLLVFLHPWSHGFDTWDFSPYQREAAQRDWHFLVPHFRGPNNRPEACASALARRDILDAVRLAASSHAVDTRRIYLAGQSGGGHMALVMAGEAPGVWAAVSAWCGITDLARWHAECREAGHKYWKDIEAAVGGAPGSSPEIDAELRYRSPLFHLGRLGTLPLDINTGIHDGHAGSVPIHHSIDAFNAIASGRGAQGVSPEETAVLSREETLPTQEEPDPAYDRAIHLRRHAGTCRLTIFEGGHEDIPAAACLWFETHARECPAALSE